MDLGKPNFSVVHHSNCDAFIVVLEPTVSTYFSAVDVGCVPNIATMIFMTHDANSARKCGRDDTGVGPALGLSLRYLLEFMITTKLKTEIGDYQPSRKNLDCKHELPSYSFLETSICVNVGFDKITVFMYVVRLDCSNGLNNDALHISLSANVVTMM